LTRVSSLPLDRPWRPGRDVKGRGRDTWEGEEPLPKLLPESPRQLHRGGRHATEGPDGADDGLLASIGGAAGIVLALWIVEIVSSLYALCGVVAHAVGRRVPEIGTRMALGATATDVRNLVLGEGLRLVGAGVALGLAFSLALSRALQGLLVGVPPTDPVTHVVTAGVLAGVALAASDAPAVRPLGSTPPRRSAPRSIRPPRGLSTSVPDRGPPAGGGPLPQETRRV